MATKKQITRKLLAAEEAIRQCTAYLSTIRREVDGLAQTEIEEALQDLGLAVGSLEKAEDYLAPFGALEEENPTDDEDEEEDEQDESEEAGE